METTEWLAGIARSILPPNRSAATQVYSDSVRGMHMHYFDMAWPDGRVYRVRVSDITPTDGD